MNKMILILLAFNFNNIKNKITTEDLMFSKWISDKAMMSDKELDNYYKKHLKIAENI